MTGKGSIELMDQGLWEPSSVGGAVTEDSEEGGGNGDRMRENDVSCCGTSFADRDGELVGDGGCTVVVASAPVRRWLRVRPFPVT